MTVGRQRHIHVAEQGARRGSTLALFASPAQRQRWGAEQGDFKGDAMAMFSSAEAYERFMGRWSIHLARRYLDFVRLGECRRILDVGCGTGAMADAIASAKIPASIVGIDPVDAFVDYCRARFTDPGYSFDGGNALELAYPNGSFDAARGARKRPAKAVAGRHPRWTDLSPRKGVGCPRESAGAVASGLRPNWLLQRTRRGRRAAEGNVRPRH